MPPPQQQAIIPPPIANSTPPKQTHLPNQPNPNPNNSKLQAQSYVISSHNIHLRFGTTLPSPQGPVIIEVEDPPIEQINVPPPQASPTAKKTPIFAKAC